MYNRTYTAHGAIFLYDMNKPKNKPVSLNIEGDFDLQDFTPHGLSVLEDKQSGEDTLTM